MPGQIQDAHRSQNWIVRKPASRSRRGVAVSQSGIAAALGARVLDEGGNAVDAAVAMGLALGAVEPWNSGLGGIGFMMVWRARERRAHVVDFGPVAPMRLNPRDFPLTGAVGGDLFAWPAVEGERNVHGALSLAVPGVVDGLGLALERFGTWSWARAMAPGIALAEDGLAVDWYTTLRAALWARDLARYETTAATWIPDGLPAATPAGAPMRRMILPGLAKTMRHLADSGPRDFYEGAIAGVIADDVAASGGVLDRADLARYRARIVEPLAVDYHGHTVLAPGGLTAGPTLARVLRALASHGFTGKAPDPEAFVAYAQALSDAYAERFQAMGDVVDTRSPASTTHLNVVDADGNMVALTQTLLSVFGSKLTLPQTGILMNNGIMWFDPRPGGPNALAPGKRPLSNMCPVLGTRDGKAWLALGGSGGRKIMPAAAQILSFLIDYGMTIEDAFHHPRIDASGEKIVSVDPRLPGNVAAALKSRFPVKLTEHVVLPTNYACPCAVMIEPDGGRVGISDVMSPWSAAMAEGAG